MPDRFACGLVGSGPLSASELDNYDSNVPLGNVRTAAIMKTETHG